MNASFHDDFVRSIIYLKLESMQSTGKLGISLKILSPGYNLIPTYLPYLGIKIVLNSLVLFIISGRNKLGLNTLPEISCFNNYNIVTKWIIKWMSSN